MSAWFRVCPPKADSDVRAPEDVRAKSGLGGEPPSNGEPLCQTDHRFAGR
jgi:hypothetical protein